MALLFCLHEAIIKIVEHCASGTERVVTHDLTSQLVIDVIHISNACFLFKGIIWLREDTYKLIV